MPFPATVPSIHCSFPYLHDFWIKPEDLVKMKDMDIREADTGGLADILEIEIDRDLSDTEKKREFIRQITWKDADIPPPHRPSFQFLFYSISCLAKRDSV